MKASRLKTILSAHLLFFFLIQRPEFVAGIAPGPFGVILQAGQLLRLNGTTLAASAIQQTECTYVRTAFDNLFVCAESFVAFISGSSSNLRVSRASAALQLTPDLSLYDKAREEFASVVLQRALKLRSDVNPASVFQSSQLLAQILNSMCKPEQLSDLAYIAESWPSVGMPVSVTDALQGKLWNASLVYSLMMAGSCEALIRLDRKRADDLRGLSVLPDFVGIPSSGRVVRMMLSYVPAVSYAAKHARSSEDQAALMPGSYIVSGVAESRTVLLFHVLSRLPLVSGSEIPHGFLDCWNDSVIVETLHGRVCAICRESLRSKSFNFFIDGKVYSYNGDKAIFTTAAQKLPVGCKEVLEASVSAVRDGTSQLRLLLLRNAIGQSPAAPRAPDDIVKSIFEKPQYLKKSCKPDGRLEAISHFRSLDESTGPLAEQLLNPWPSSSCQSIFGSLVKLYFASSSVSAFDPSNQHGYHSAHLQALNGATVPMDELDSRLFFSGADLIISGVLLDGALVPLKSLTSQASTLLSYAALLTAESREPEASIVPSNSVKEFTASPVVTVIVGSSDSENITCLPLTWLLQLGKALVAASRLVTKSISIAVTPSMFSTDSLSEKMTRAIASSSGIASLDPYGPTLADFVGHAAKLRATENKVCPDLMDRMSSGVFGTAWRLDRQSTETQIGPNSLGKSIDGETNSLRMSIQYVWRSYDPCKGFIELAVLHGRQCEQSNLNEICRFSASDASLLRQLHETSSLYVEEPQTSSELERAVSHDPCIFSQTCLPSPPASATGLIAGISVVSVLIGSIVTFRILMLYSPAFRRCAHNYAVGCRVLFTGRE